MIPTIALLTTLSLACAGDDGDRPKDRNDTQEPDNDDDDGGRDNDNGGDECRGPSDCPNVVCDCADGPVNYKGCDNGVCATTDACAVVCADWDSDEDG